MRLHQIRNATLIIEFSRKRFLVDPMFAGVNGLKGVKGELLPLNNSENFFPLHDLPFSPKDILKNIDAVIITHLHTDHFDKFAKDLIPKGMKIFVQDIFDKNALEKEHFNNLEIVKSEGTEFEGVKLYKTECCHGIRPFVEPIFLANGMRWEAMGVVFKAENEPVLYLAGDTVWYKGVKEALDIHKPKHIILNTSCTVISNNEPVIMGIDDIKEIHEYYPYGKLIASHMDCSSNSTLSRADLRASEVKDYIYTPADGEMMYLE